jgi:glutamate dehydrogenase
VLPEIFENTYFKQQLFQAFPQVLQERYAAEMETHPLKAEIIATKLANMLVNDMGANFAQRMMEETGANIAEVAISFAIARDLFDLPKVWSELESLDNVIAAECPNCCVLQTSVHTDFWQFIAVLSCCRSGVVTELPTEVSRPASPG